MPESLLSLPDLAEAAEHLRWLLERGYPKQASVKLVGDRHRLDRAARQILYRGVVSREDALRRRGLLAGPEGVGGTYLGVDGHNVVLTVANFLAGVPVFIADDGLVRDIGALHGRLHDAGTMHRCLDLVADAIGSLSPSEVLVVFDEPLSHSRDHAKRFRDRLSVLLPADRCRVETALSGDEALKSAGPSVIATSDSAIVDALAVPVFDLAGWILEREFHPNLPSISCL